MAEAPFVADPYPSETHSKTTQKRKQADENDTRKAQPWSRTTEIIKGHAYVRTVSTRGGGLSWTLNLGGKVAQAANDNPKGLKERMHDRLSKALKASPLGARDFVFSVETTKAGRWHLHGVLDATPGERAQVEEMLRKVGGAWNSMHHEDKQARARTVVWGADGWARYLMKGSAMTRRLLETQSVLSVTRGCRQRAETLWEASRREASQEARQRPAAPEAPQTAQEPAKPASEPRKPAPPTWALWLRNPIRSLALPGWAEQSRPLAIARSRGPPWLGPPATFYASRSSRKRTHRVSESVVTDTFNFFVDDKASLDHTPGVGREIANRRPSPAPGEHYEPYDDRGWRSSRRLMGKSDNPASRCRWIG